MKTYLIEIKPFRGMPVSCRVQARHPGTAIRRALDIVKDSGEQFRDAIGVKLIVTVERIL